MIVELELINGKKYLIEYNDGTDKFLDEVKYEDKNGFFRATDGTYIIINKIVSFNIK